MMTVFCSYERLMSYLLDRRAAAKKIIYHLMSTLILISSLWEGAFTHIDNSCDFDKCYLDDLLEEL